MRIFSYITCLLILFNTANSFSQANSPVKISWGDLTDVKFNRKYHKELEEFFLFPTFGPKVRSLEGKIIEIKGYMIPVSLEENLLVISSKPMASCFFCGAAGPESIIQVKMSRKTVFKTDQVATIQGKLKLNPDDINELNYILLDSSVSPPSK